MKNSDATLLKTVFADSAILQTIAKNKAGETISQKRSYCRFYRKYKQVYLWALLMNRSVLKSLKLMETWPVYGLPINFISMETSAIVV